MPGDDSKAEISADSERTQQRRLKNRQSTQLDNLDNNPCSKEHRMATECSIRNAGDKDQCKVYFTNYRTCMEFWNNIKSERRLQRIRPLLPPPEEREHILREHHKFKH